MSEFWICRETPGLGIRPDVFFGPIDLEAQGLELVRGMNKVPGKTRYFLAKRIEDPHQTGQQPEQASE